ncbi:MAG: O-methyltransferase [Deltaproteobacteria bacterium]|nr:O-methyltransferase [Deltaproteobacteria bacterium]
MADQDSRKGVSYVTPEVLAWIERVHVPHDPASMRAFESPEREGMPAIQVGASEGKTLALLLRLVAARKVVELGTLAGYSAIQMGRALAKGGQLWTVELEPRHAAVARANIEAAGLGAVVTVIEGRALDVLEGLASKGPFDAIFIDADKGSYDRYGRWAARAIRPGGLLLADNAYYFGDLLADTAEAAAMRRFHEESREHFETVCIPTPEGLLLGIRKG